MGASLRAHNLTINLVAIPDRPLSPTTCSSCPSPSCAWAIRPLYLEGLGCRVLVLGGRVECLGSQAHSSTDQDLLLNLAEESPVTGPGRQVRQERRRPALAAHGA